jgi:hypothetical protein
MGAVGPGEEDEEAGATFRPGGGLFRAGEMARNTRHRSFSAHHYNISNNLVILNISIELTILLFFVINDYMRC